MDYETPAFYIKVLSVLSYFILNLFGWLRDFLMRIGIEQNRIGVEKNREVIIYALSSMLLMFNYIKQGYVPLYSGYGPFYTRNIYRRIRNGWNQPVCSLPGATIDLMDRVSDDYFWTFR